ncbi:MULTISPECIES: NAD-dependent epimerase/dehydratase family protein [Paenibacillus]|uniref:NAD-dependent epimerase/dehydratase family protein n=1 Tax=Paenibacillus sp. ALJ109b TaxID=2709068 RepID=UPI001F07DD57|nr:NAD-dependent epimerase/dehydratase family protein [Paenibacillus sp. ALJ109b]
MSKTALIGYTGFVGSTLLRQTQFDDLYNSSNINTIHGKNYELVICAAAPAVKWKANQSPEEDLKNINSLISSLKEIKAKRFVLISTVDVYKNPIEVMEDTEIFSEETEPYGRHRYYLEQFVMSEFENHIIVRLPGLFGKGLKKNFIYDLIHSNALDITHHKSKFQFYNMDNLWEDIIIALDSKICLVNMTSEPVSAEEIAEFSLDISFKNVTEKAPVFYDMRSKHASMFNKNSKDGYMKSKKMILQEISNFIEEQKEIIL